METKTHTHNEATDKVDTQEVEKDLVIELAKLARKKGHEYICGRDWNGTIQNSEEALKDWYLFLDDEDKIKSEYNYDTDETEIKSWEEFEKEYSIDIIGKGDCQELIEIKYNGGVYNIWYDSLGEAWRIIDNNKEKIDEIIKDIEEDNFYKFENQDKIRNEMYDGIITEENQYNQFHIEFKNDEFYMIEQTPIYPNEHGVSNTWEMVNERPITKEETKEYIKENGN